METYEHLENDLPEDAAERAARGARLLDLIERTNAAIERHTNHTKSDQLAIRQYTELRDDYVREFAELLQPVGVIVLLPPDRRAA